MKQNDKRLWHKCGSAINRLFLWLFIAFAILLAVDLWILLISAIVVLFDYSATLLLVIKILSACAIVFVILSHIALWQIMYSPNIYNRLISIVWHKRIRLLIYLSYTQCSIYHIPQAIVSSSCLECDFACTNSRIRILHLNSPQAVCVSNPLDGILVTHFRRFVK